MTRFTLLALTVTILALSISQASCFDEQFNETFNSNPMTYGSAFRIENRNTKHFLHSEDMRYGSGSRQQIITANKDFADWDSLWMLKSAHGFGHKVLNTEIKCGDKVRLEHVRTGRNLHSHKV